MTTLQHRKKNELEASSVKASRAFVDSGLHGIEAEVVLVLDHSPRMAPLYLNGSLQTLVTSLMALAMKFDDDGVVPVWTFTDEARDAGKVQRDDVVEWVAQHVQAPATLRPGMRLPATRYAPFIDAIGQRYFPDEWAQAPKVRLVGEKLKRQVHDYPALIEPRPCPLLVVVVTSGDCEDALETTRQLRRASKLPIFWQFAAVNPNPSVPSELRFLRGIDKLTETHVDSCGFFVAEDFASEDLFRGLLGEFQHYLERPEVKAMLVTAVAEDTSDSNDRIIAQEFLSLPEREAKKREAARVERERRRAEREYQNALEAARQSAYPKVAPDADADEALQQEASERQLAAYYETEPALDEVTVAALVRSPVKRETLPYGETVDGKRAIARPATRAFERFSDAPPPEADADEDTVETAAERLMRIRARREARRGGAPE